MKINNASIGTDPCLWASSLPHRIRLKGVMKQFLIHWLYRLALIGLLGVALSAASPVAWASSEEHGKEDTPKAAAKEEGGKSTVVQVPKRTFEGQEPLFYLNSDRRPFVEPLRKSGEESYYICRGTVGYWFRELVAQEASMLAQRNGFETVKSDLCALRLIETRTGKKRPIISVEFYLSSEHMQACILGEICPNARSAIMFVKDKALYRSYLIGDSKLGQVKEYCLDNRSNILANEPCWKYFANLDQDKAKAKDESKSAQQEAKKAEEEAKQAAKEAEDATRKARTARREAREKGQPRDVPSAAPAH